MGAFLKLSRNPSLPLETPQVLRSRQRHAAMLAGGAAKSNVGRFLNAAQCSGQARATLFFQKSGWSSVLRANPIRSTAASRLLTPCLLPPRGRLSHGGAHTNVRGIAATKVVRYFWWHCSKVASCRNHFGCESLTRASISWMK